MGDELKLLECPFCNSVVVMKRSGGDNSGSFMRWYVECPDCGCGTRMEFIDRATCVNRWNRRTNCQRCAELEKEFADYKDATNISPAAIREWIADNEADDKLIEELQARIEELNERLSNAFEEVEGSVPATEYNLVCDQKHELEVKYKEALDNNWQIVKSADYFYKKSQAADEVVEDFVSYTQDVLDGKRGRVTTKMREHLDMPQILKHEEEGEEPPCTCGENEACSRCPND